MSIKSTKASSTASGPGPARPGGAPRRSLTTRIVILMLLVSLVPLVALGAAWLSSATQEIRENEDLTMRQTADALVGEVDEWVAAHVRILQTLARTPAIIALTADDQGATKAVLDTHPWMHMVYTVGKDGRCVVRSDGKVNVDYSDRTYFRDVVLLGQPLAWQSIVGKTSGLPSLVLAVPIKVNEVVIGMVATSMPTASLSKSIATWHKGRTGYAFLVDDQKKVISHPNKEYVAAQTNLRAHPLMGGLAETGRPIALQAFQDSQGRSLVGLSRMTRLGWSLVVEQDEAEVFADLFRARLWVGLLVAATLVLVGLVAWRTATALVRPIVELTGMANRMSMGDLEVRMDIESQDEIGMLAQAFGRMQFSLRAAMERLRRPPPK
jgi:methyl-accepting chemotaxis protein